MKDEFGKDVKVSFIFLIKNRYDAGKKLQQTFLQEVLLENDSIERFG